MKVYLISYRQTKNNKGEYVNNEWKTYDQVFGCKNHAEMEVQTLKSLIPENEVYSFVINERNVK